MEITVKCANPTYNPEFPGTLVVERSFEDVAEWRIIEGCLIIRQYYGPEGEYGRAQRLALAIPLERVFDVVEVVPE